MSAPESEKLPTECNNLTTEPTDPAAISSLSCSLKDADEALDFLSNHPESGEISIQGAAIIADPVASKKLLRKIDLTIAPLLAAVYFLQYLDKTTLSYTAVMGIREDTHLVGQVLISISLFCRLISCPPRPQSILLWSSP